MRLKRWLRVPVLTCFTGCLTSLTACEPAARGASSPRTSPHPTWTFESTPLFSVSAVPFTPDSLFFVRVSHGVFTGDGDIVITVAGDQNRVVYLDSAGELLTVCGRTGEGPGEFQRLAGLFALEGEVAVWDRLNRRMSLFKHRQNVGEYAIPISARHETVGILSDGTIVSTPGRFAPNFQNTIGQEPEPQVYHLWSREGAELQTLAGVLSLPAPVLSLQFMRDGREHTVGSLDSPCLPVLRHVARQDDILIADGGAGMLLSLAHSGALTLLQSEVPRDTVTSQIAAEAEAWIERMERSAGGQATRESKRRVLEKIGIVGELLPSVWTEMVADRQGGAWLLRARCFSPPSATATWDVFDAQGQLQASARLPSTFRVLAVDGNRVLGVLRDDLGVENVTVFVVREATGY